MKQSPALRQAARIAEKFHLDPWQVLDSDFFTFAARSAALSYILDLEEAAERRAKQRSK
jgi:hypothetical protein